MEELYRSDTIVVRCVPQADRSRWVITFDNHSIGAGFDRPGFGEAFLAREGISAIHVLGRGDDWYHYPDVLDAAAVVREATASADRRLTYGSSMGGFAALRLADAVGADAVLALSPQYSIAPDCVPWETRWSEDAARIVPQPALCGPIRCACRPFIVFDPMQDDARHAAMIMADIRCWAIRLPYAGHPVSTYLAEIGILSRMMLGVLEGGAKSRRLTAMARRRRRKSSAYLGNLAESQPACRPRTAIAIGRLATAVAPGSPLARIGLARALARAGENPEALLRFHEAVELGQRDPVFLIPYADALVAADRIEEAIAIGREACAALPDRAHLRHWLAWMHAKRGDMSSALHEEQEALRLAPDSALFADTLDKYRAQRSAARWQPQRLLRLIRR